MKISFADLLRHPSHLLAFGFGSGLSPKAPGTAGTLAAIPFAYGLLQLPIAAQLLIILMTFALGVYVCDKTARDLGVHDFGGIVWDEFVGYWIAICAFSPTWQTLLLGFVFFRIFDVLKPWPISILDRKVHGGFGIMIDDVLAGMFAWVSLYFSNQFFIGG